jgi:hypothetical protein
MDFIYDPSLVLYLPLYQLDGASFADKSAYGHLCTVTGALWRSNGHFFDGTDDLIDCGNPPALQITGGLSLGAWVKVDTLSAPAGIITKDARGGNPTRGYSFAFTAEGKPQMVVWDGILPNFYIPSNIEVDDNTWHLVFGTFVPSTSVNVYIDDALDATNTTNPASVIQDVATDVHIGDYDAGGGSEQFLTGNLGECWIFNRALTPLEIQNIYLATKWRYR